MDKKAVVIGGAGFIGSHLVAKLRDQEWDVRVIDNMSNIYKRTIMADYVINIAAVSADCLADIFKGAHTVFHLAARTLANCETYPESAYKEMVAGMNNVLHGARYAEVSNIVYSSSASVYGNKKCAHEHHALNGITLYAAAKIAGEVLASAFSAKYKIPVISLRYANVYGYKQPRGRVYTDVVCKTIAALLGGKPAAIFNGGDQVYDFIHVDDVVRANLLAATHKQSDVFNVGTGVGTSIKRLVGLIAKELDICDYAVLDWHHVPDKRMVTHRVLDTVKAAELLYFGATISLETGLKQLIEQMKGDRDGLIKN